ncbi:hypothetical protein HYU45_02520 [Candidatus Daviesbacteria bacterium]|nr:hypothetical protein [Candidatus Daviesbacteria bacterium]
MTNLKTLLIFLLTAVLIIFLGFDFLKPAFDIGLTPEDREFILRYKLIGQNPLTKILQFWSERGAYTTIPIYYIGIVQSIAGFNYQLIQFIGMVLRVLAALSIFPLTNLLFKNMPLAFLATIIFAFSYTTTGALETGVEPSEYLGLFVMNIFLIAYYFLNTKYFLNIWWLLLTSLLLFVAVMASIMRVYPILFFIPMVEIFLLFSNRKKYKFKYLFYKLFIFYLPFFLLVRFSPSATSGHFSLPTILLKIAQGNWHLLLIPFQGLGFMIPVYMAFLLGGPLIIFGLMSLMLSLVCTTQKLPFFLRVLLLNFGLETLAYWIIQRRLLSPVELRMNFDAAHLYPILFGLFIFSLMINSLIDWYRSGKKNNLLFILWMGPFIGLFFITMTYIFAGINLSFGGAQDHYLLIPTIGISLFISGILLAMYERLSVTRFKSIGGFAVVVIILAFLYGLNREKTHSYFTGANYNGRAAAGQEFLQGKIREIFRNLDYSKPVLVYFDTSDIPDGKGPFYSEGLLTPFPVLMYFRGENIVNGCIGVIYENRKMKKLKKAIKIIGNQQAIVYQTTCVENGKINIQDVIYKADNFYALKIKDENLINIKDQVIKELKFR